MAKSFLSNAPNLSSQGWISHVLKAKLAPQKVIGVPGLCFPSFNHSLYWPAVRNTLSFFTPCCSVFVLSDGKDLFTVVAELKHAHHKLSEQNSSLLRTVAQCEDVNLQLTLEVTELRAKVARWGTIDSHLKFKCVLSHFRVTSEEYLMWNKILETFNIQICVSVCYTGRMFWTVNQWVQLWVWLAKLLWESLSVIMKSWKQYNIFFFLTVNTSLNFIVYKNTYIVFKENYKRTKSNPFDKATK